MGCWSAGNYVATCSGSNYSGHWFPLSCLVTHGIEQLCKNRGPTAVHICCSSRWGRFEKLQEDSCTCRFGSPEAACKLALFSCKSQPCVLISCKVERNWQLLFKCPHPHNCMSCHYNLVTIKMKFCSVDCGNKCQSLRTT